MVEQSPLSHAWLKGRGAAQGKAPLVLEWKGVGTNSVELAFTKWNSLNPTGSCIRQVELVF